MKIYILLILLSFNCFSQTNFYVDKVNGNDLFNGTSITTAWKTIQKAANSATANSIVNIKAGTYNENIIVNVSGTVGNLIVFKNYLNDVVIIDGTGTTGNTLITISNKNNLQFENLTIQNKTVNGAQGILVETTGTSTSTNLTFKNIKIKNINWTTNATATATASTNAQGLIVYGRNGGITNLTIDGCEISNNILGYSEALAINGNVDGFVVKNCLVHDNNNIGIDIIGHEGTASPMVIDEARNGVVKNNICYKNISPYATSGGIYVDGSSNVIIEKNSCYENGWGIEVGAELNGTTNNITVKNNLIYNNKQAGLSIGGYNTATTGQVTNSIIRNNTFFQNNSLNDGTGEISMTKTSNTKFENNIFYTNSQNVFMSVDNIMPQTGNIFNYNSWFTPNNNANSIVVNWRGTTYSTFASYKTGTSQEANSIYGNPNVVTPSLTAPNFQLLSSSQCINAGNPSTVIASGETDYQEFARIANSIIDIGAYEFGSTLGFKNNTKLNYKVYPNPSSGILNIDFDDEINEVKITIFNALGQVIKSEIPSKSSQTLNLSELVNGIYFVEIKQNNSKQINKIIIKK